MRVSSLVHRVCMVCLLVNVQLSTAQPVAELGLKPFTTDGCSLWVDGTPENPHLWRHCCVAHDKDYWLGGTEAQRKLSDGTLRACVTQAGGKAMGEYLYLNVRWGGAPMWLMPYRWGYGWDYLEEGKSRGYKTPNEAEQALIKLRLPQAEQLIRDDAIKHSALIDSEKK